MASTSPRPFRACGWPLQRFGDCRKSLFITAVESLTCRDFAIIFSNDTSCVTLLSSIIVLQPISTSNYCDLKLVPWRRASTWSSLALVRLTASRWHHFFLSNVGRILRVVRSEDVPRMRTRCQLKDIRFGETSLIPAGRGCIVAGTNSST
jgi:hypothetical protein